jgi:hypothetical protein
VRPTTHSSIRPLIFWNNKKKALECWNFGFGQKRCGDQRLGKIPEILLNKFSTKTQTSFVDMLKL